MGSSIDRTYSGIDLMAPGIIHLYFNNDSNGYGTEKIFGTSFAAPAVAGTAALFKDALHYIGWSSAANDARKLLVNMLLFGDAWDSDSGDKRRLGIGEVSGYGRARPHYPSSLGSAVNLSSPWGWGTQARHIYQGETLEWPVWSSGPESPYITQWKWALTWFEDDLAKQSDIVIAVVDSCAGNVVIASDLSYDFRKRIHLRQAEIANKCLVMRATAHRTPSSGTTFYTADYFHGGDADTQH
jgi:hypothetical protein